MCICGKNQNSFVNLCILIHYSLNMNILPYLSKTKKLVEQILGLDKIGGTYTFQVWTYFYIESAIYSV